MQSQPSDSPPQGLPSVAGPLEVHGTPQNVNGTEGDSTWTVVDRTKPRKQKKEKAKNNKEKENQAGKPSKPKKCHILAAPRGKAHNSLSTSKANFSKRFEMEYIESCSLAQSA